MKRSEFIKLVYSELKKIGIRTGSEHDSYDLLECDAKEILGIIEMLGMLPPQNSSPISHYNLDALQCLTESFHKWDKE